MLYLIGGLIFFLLLNAPIRPYWNGLGLSEPILLLSFGLLLFLTPFKILEWEDDASKIPYKIMFLFGAGFSFCLIHKADLHNTYIYGDLNINRII